MVSQLLSIVMELNRNSLCPLMVLAVLCVYVCVLFCLQVSSQPVFLGRTIEQRILGGFFLVQEGLCLRSSQGWL